MLVIVIVLFLNFWIKFRYYNYCYKYGVMYKINSPF